jgi:radical SAM superfamily enzyme YgiQ (UPF0313 family)
MLEAPSPQTSKIILTTLNSKYQHSSFGLRYLYANLNHLRSEAQLLEFTIAQNPRDIAQTLLSRKPEIIGLGVYIWNAVETLELITILKLVAPEVKIVLGGPEISFETEQQELFTFADYVIQGEGDFLFRDLCEKLLYSPENAPKQKIILPALPELSQIHLPYDLYSDDDIKNRVLYVEASRGCPYKCEYCLSSLDVKVRNFDTDLFLGEMQKLITRGARQFKFVDRTFNLNIQISRKILHFFLDRIELGLFLHFEMVPDRLPDELKDLIEKFPEGALQFEIGIQTWNPEVSKTVSRKQDYQKIAENFDFLNTRTQVHTHADLIFGLPGETLESFARGVDALWSLKPHEIQIGILKKLRGTPIARHDKTFSMKYELKPPYSILKNSVCEYETVQAMVRFSSFWDHVINQGQFKKSVELLQELAITRSDRSFFFEMYDLSEFLFATFQKTHSISLNSYALAIWKYFVNVRKLDPAKAAEALLADYCFGSTFREVPDYLRPYSSVDKDTLSLKRSQSSHSKIPKRQQRHLEI